MNQLVWTDWTVDQLVEYGQASGATNLVYSTVVQPNAALKTQLEARFRTMELTTETALPFKNQYSTPQTLGKDRLAAVAGAHALFPGDNCLVVDCGTCIKYDMLTADGIYLGGNIAPGAQMRIKAMHHFTAKLPEVPMQMPDDVIGYSTETALQNGALRGASLEIAGFVKLFEEKYTSLRVVLTGGDAIFFKPFLTFSIDSIVPDLTLHGLNSILIFNT